MDQRRELFGGPHPGWRFRLHNSLLVIMIGSIVVISVSVAPLPVFTLLPTACALEVTIVFVVFSQVLTVRVVFAVIPLMIVMVGAVIDPLLSIVLVLLLPLVIAPAFILLGDGRCRS